MIRLPARHPASFARIQPGDVLTHPTSGHAIAKVIDVRHYAQEKAGKPTKYTMTIIAEEFHDDER